MQSALLRAMAPMALRMTSRSSNALTSSYSSLAPLRSMIPAVGAAAGASSFSFSSSSSPPSRFASSYRRRHRRDLPTNTGINFVPQMEAWVVERFGKFHDVLDPGLNLLIPLVDEIKYVHSLKEIIIEVPSQSAITQDNVTLHLDGVLYVKIEDAYAASYGVEDPEYAVAQLAQTTMRSELGKLTLDSVFRERANLNQYIVEAINMAARPWGVSCLRCEIRDISLPDRVVDDMQRQVSAERKKRASILESEGVRQAEINVAEGAKQNTVLTSQAARERAINEAEGEAQAIVAKAEATAEAIRIVAEAVESRPGGRDAVALQVAQQYVESFGNIAKEGNTLLLPADVSSPAAMISQALGIYGTVTNNSNFDSAGGSSSSSNEAGSAATTHANTKLKVPTGRST